MKHVYFVNAHPDDLLAVIGTALKLKNVSGCALHVVDMTHGERGLAWTTPPDECAAIRDVEERTVCSYLGVEPVWLQEHDGDSFASEESTRQLAEMYVAEPPDVIFTQWPVDLHLDHMVCATVALNAFRMASGITEGRLLKGWPEVYFYHYAGNSLADSPDYFVPLTEAEVKVKTDIISLYRCQNGPIMAETEKKTNLFYGSRIGTEYAEAFTRMQPLIAGRKAVLDGLLGK